MYTFVYKNIFVYIRRQNVYVCIQFVYIRKQMFTFVNIKKRENMPKKTTKFKVVSARVREDLYNWLIDKSEQKDCSISEILNDIIARIKHLDNVPDNMLFSDLINIQASKASIMSYRLIEKIAYKILNEEDAKLIETAINRAKEDIETWKIK